MRKSVKKVLLIVGLVVLSPIVSLLIFGMFFLCISYHRNYIYTPPVNYIPELNLYISYDERSSTLYLGKDSTNLSDKIVYGEEPTSGWDKILFVGQDGRIYAFGRHDRAPKKVYEKELDITTVTINDSSTVMRCSKPINASEWIYQDTRNRYHDYRFCDSDFGDISINSENDHGTISMKRPKYVINISFLYDLGMNCHIGLYDSDYKYIRQYDWK